MLKKCLLYFTVVITGIISLSTNAFADVKLTESNFTRLLDWSYDGKKILFATSKNNNCSNLATISPDGKNETQITIDEGMEWDAVFHPDGSIYYIWMDNTGTKLCKINSDGSGKKILLTVSQDYDYLNPTLIISPISAKIGYILRQNAPPYRYTLWVCNLDGTGNRQLTNAYPDGLYIDFSPNGEWIVFKSTAGYLYKIKINDTELTQLTTFYASSPDWSPDGTKIVFSSEDDIYLINSDGTGLTNLTGDGYTTSDYYPKWSPDGKKILWERDYTLWVMNSDGTGKLELFTSKVYVDYVWNKSSNKIALSNYQNIYIINSDGTGGLQKITNSLNPAWQVVGGTSFSGDYQKIIFISHWRDPITFKLRIMNKDGSNKYDLLTSTYGGIYSLSFAPHTTKIVYQLEINSKIYTINSDASGETYLTDGHHPVWSNDTTRIVYISTWSVTGNYLCVMNSDGSNIVQITPCASYDYYPKWSPDDTKILYVYNDDIYIALSSPPYTVTQITKDGAVTKECFPVFSPDGTKIAYTVEKYAEPDELWVINTDGTGATKLTDNAYYWPGIKWAKNNRIYYIYRENFFFGHIYSITPDGTDKRKENSTSISTGIWGPFDVSPTGEVVYNGMFDIFSIGISPTGITQQPLGEVKPFIIESPDDRGKGTLNPDKGEKAQIYFKGTQEGKFTCKIFTLAGELVYEETKHDMPEGYFEWSPKDIASGVYIVYVEGPGVKAHKKIAVVR